MEINIFIENCLYSERAPSLIIHLRGEPNIEPCTPFYEIENKIT